MKKKPNMHLHKMNINTKLIFKYTVLLVCAFWGLKVYSQINSNRSGYLSVASMTRCSITPRQVLCWDMSSTPSRYREIEINGCESNCESPYRAVCSAGYLSGRNCTDYLEPSNCSCN